MRWPSKVWLGFWIMVLLVSAGFFILETCFHTIGNGAALGARRWRDEYHLICGIHLSGGDVWYYRYVIPTGFDPNMTVQSHDRNWTLLGFRYIPYFATPRDWYYAVAVPFWAILLLSGFMVLRIAGRIRRFRRRPGMCHTCGYDLRASRERCPECGSAVVREANPAAVC